MNQDIDQLRLLSIFHYIVALLAALVSCIPFIHLVFGLVMVFSPESLESGPHHDEAMLSVMGMIFILFASSIILGGWAFAVCIFLAGRNLARHRRYTFCLVIGAIMCIFIPFGTVLGVFTTIVLVRPSVRLLFEGHVDTTDVSST